MIQVRLRNCIYYTRVDSLQARTSKACIGQRVGNFATPKVLNLMVPFVTHSFPHIVSHGPGDT